MGIAREGWPVIVAAGAALGAVALVGTLAGHPVAVVPLVAVVGFLFWFFRDPERTPPPGDRVLVSPADGRVLGVVPVTEDVFLEAPATCISVFMSPLDVHVNRAPVSGEVISIAHTPGQFRAAFRDEASLHNERNLIVFHDHQGRRHAMVQVAGYLARRIVCRLHPSDVIERGQRVGMIMFGSRVDHFMPLDYRVAVKIGDRVRAGESTLGECER